MLVEVLVFELDEKFWFERVYDFNKTFFVFNVEEANMI